MNAKLMARGIRFAVLAGLFLFSRAGAEQVLIDDEIVEAPPDVVRIEKKPDEKLREADAAGDQVLELTDGSQLHGQLVSLGKSEVVWKRADAEQPLIFSPQEVRRLILGKPLPLKEAKANATLKLRSNDWITGELSALHEGKFQIEIVGATKLEVERGNVEWLALSPTAPPDAYDGPVGPMGMSGWDTGGETGGAWDYADGAFIAKTPSLISRSFDALSEKVDIQFTSGDGGSNNRGMAMWIQPGKNIRGYSKGSVYLRFQANSVNANVYTGEQMKNFSADIPIEKEEKKISRYRLLFDRKDGRLIVFMNGKQITDWDFPEAKEAPAGGLINWQPNYWNSESPWTLSNIRVQPWDGYPVPDAKDDEAGKDLIKAAATERKAGKLEGITPDAVKFSGADVSRKEAIFLRLASPANAEPPPATVARVWLSTRGEFDVTGIGFRDGQLKVRTSFAGDLALPLSAIRAIEFPHKATAAEKAVADGGDTLIFKNGDQLRGTLSAASNDQPLQWKPVKGDKLIAFAPGRLAGVLLASRKDAPAFTGGAAVRFQNGDWLPGKLLALDGQKLRLGTALSGELNIARSGIRTVYFGAEGEAPVWDGASQREAWMSGTTVPGYYGSSRAKKDEKKPNPWRYFDGAFTLISGSSRNGNGQNLGRKFDTLPEKVDISFELSTTKGPAAFAIQLFVEENRQSGIMVQGSWDSVYLYDMSPRKQGGAFFNQPQQIEFGQKLGGEANRRHFRFLADRKTGRLWMFVNGQLVGQLKRRSSSEDNPKPGKGVAIIPQPMGARVTVSNLWVAPWSGALPVQPKKDDKGEKEEGVEKKKEEKKPEPPTSDALALVNGDETQGEIVSATADTLTIKCDAGELDIPIARTLIADFASPPAAAKPGIRLRFAGKGALTVQSFKIENGKVVCQSANAGELSFPASALSEIVFQPNQVRPFEGAGGKDGSAGQAGGVWQGGFGEFQIDGGVEVLGGGRFIIRE